MDGNQQVEHHITGDDLYIKETVVHCSCGAHWSYPNNRTQEERDSIFESHKAYFNNKTVVL